MSSILCMENWHWNTYFKKYAYLADNSVELKVSQLASWRGKCQSVKVPNIILWMLHIGAFACDWEKTWDKTCEKGSSLPHGERAGGRSRFPRLLRSAEAAFVQSSSQKAPPTTQLKYHRYRGKLQSSLNLTPKSQNNAMFEAEGRTLKSRSQLERSSLAVGYLAYSLWPGWKITRKVKPFKFFVLN